MLWLQSESKQNKSKWNNQSQVDYIIYIEQVEIFQKKPEKSSVMQNWFNNVRRHITRSVLCFFGLLDDRFQQTQIQTKIKKRQCFTLPPAVMATLMLEEFNRLQYRTHYLLATMQVDHAHSTKSHTLNLPLIDWLAWRVKRV